MSSAAPFEAVIDSATGVGKTYILAGAMELLAATSDVRDFVVITPGRTILEKTRDNFTPGHPKSLLAPMSFSPVVITTENFATPAMRSAMDDETAGEDLPLHGPVADQAADQGRRARRTSSRRASARSSTPTSRRPSSSSSFADEHHCYYGPAFSAAVRDLDPWLLVGLTATPAKTDAGGADHLPLPARPRRSRTSS